VEEEAGRDGSSGPVFLFRLRLCGGGIFDPHTHRRLSERSELNVSEGATQLALLCSCFVLVCSEGGAGPAGESICFWRAPSSIHNIAVAERSIHSYLPQLNGQTAPLGGAGRPAKFKKSEHFISPPEISH
jgi:hypothetical protein